MVKTFEQWFEDLPQDKKRYLWEICDADLINRDSIQCLDEDGNEVHNSENRKNAYEYKLNMSFLDKHDENNAWSSHHAIHDNYRKHMYENILNASRLIQAGNGLISDREIDEMFRENATSLNINLLKEIMTKQSFKIMARKLANKGSMNMRLMMCIYASEDPEHPDWSLLIDPNDQWYHFDKTWLKIIPFEEALKLARKNIHILIQLKEYIYGISDLNERQRLQDRFFEFLFSKDGLGIRDRKKAITILYGLEEFSSFAYDILSIDIRYIKLLKDIFRQKRLDDREIVRSLNVILSSTKRGGRLPEEREKEDFFDSPEADDYRYSKKLRQIITIYKACVERKIPKTKQSFIGDGLCLIKLYDYDFNRIFDDLYGDSDC